MFLSPVRSRVAHARALSDRGAALATVVGVAVMFALLGAVLVATAVFAGSTAIRGGAVSQAQAAADSAIDSRLAEINGALGADVMAIGNWCTPVAATYATANGSTAIETDVVFAARIGGATVETCDVTAADEILGATITANGATTSNGIDQSTTFTRAWVADYEYTERDGSLSGEGDPSVFDRALWSNSDFKVTNNMKVTGGVFTNKVFSCSVKATIDGDLTAIGEGSFTNACLITGQLHLGKKLTCSSASVFKGPVFVAGGDVNEITNTCTFEQKFTTNSKLLKLTSAPVFKKDIVMTGRSWSGDVMNADKSNVVDNAGEITASNDSVSLLGNVTAGSVSTTFGSPFTSLVKPGNVLLTGASTRSAPVEQPRAESMPILHASDVKGQAAFSTPTARSITIAQWTKEIATKNGMASWGEAYLGTLCDLRNTSYSLNGDITVDVPTIIDASSCGSQLKFASITVNLKADLAIISKNGLRIESGFTLKDARPLADRPKDLRFWGVVPVPDGVTSTCPSPGGKDINFAATPIVFDPAIRVLLYATNQVTLSNPVALTGTIYACNQDLSNDQVIYYKDPGFYEPDGQYCFSSEGDRWTPAPGVDAPCSDTSVKYFAETRRFAVGLTS